jgi:hypothetical protein
MATRNFWAAANRAEEGLIAACTSLKMKVELRINNLPMEHGEFGNISELRKWVRAKVKQYGLHTPGVKVELIAL